jgi:cell wall-associated NlpC family hydrolase
LLAQAFKLLLEPYAWGDSRLGIFGRDCSRLVRDVYATTGIIWPRNANQQEQVGNHRATFTPEMDDATRRRLIAEQVPPGALLIMPGHVMLYLGHIDGEPFAIHATSSGPYSHVIVSDLSLGQEVSLLQRLTHAVESF